jgi:hypothetical protein
LRNALLKFLYSLAGFMFSCGLGFDAFFDSTPFRSFIGFGRSTSFEIVKLESRDVWRVLRMRRNPIASVGDLAAAKKQRLISSSLIPPVCPF